MDQSLKKILHKIWDKYQVYDEKLIRKFLTGFKELDSIELRNEFRNWFGGDDAVFNKVEEFLSKPKHARVGGYDFDYKPINWDINVSNNHDMWVELDSSVVDANGKVTLDGYDGNTYDIGEVMDGEEFSGEDNMAWEVNDEINDIIRLQLKDLLIKNFGIDLVYYNNLVYDDQAFEKSLKESIRRILREEYGRKYILYRGVGLDEAIKSCETGHLVYYSRDPMSRDWEVIEYGLGSEASEMSEEEVEEYVNNLVSWKRKSKGVNLTSDLDNAKGYSDIVLEINLVGYDYAEFSDVHIFAKNPEDCKIKSVYYNGKEYSKEEFLDITKSLQESIKKILREELKSTFFRRRVDLKKVKKLLSIMAQNVYDNTKSYEQFKYELTLWAVEHIMWDEYELGWDDLQEQEEIKFVEEVSDLFEKDIKLLYNSYKKE